MITPPAPAVEVLVLTRDYGAYGWCVYRDAVGELKETRLGWFGGETGDDRDAEALRVYCATAGHPRQPLMMLDADEWRALEGWGDLDAFHEALLDGQVAPAYDVLRAALADANGTHLEE